MYDARNNLSDQVVADVKQFMGDKVYETIIPRNVRVSEAPSYGKPVLLYDFKCSGSQAYLKLASEVVQRERGLAALVGDAVDETAALDRARGGQRRVPIEFLRPNPRNPRRRFDEEELAELAASIGEKGILQPILVRGVAGKTNLFEIVAGERRWRAAQKAGLRDVPVLLMD